MINLNPWKPALCLLYPPGSIELAPAELARALELREKIHTLLKAASIRYVTLDLAGYRLGSLNEALGSVRQRTNLHS